MAPPNAYVRGRSRFRQWALSVRYNRDIHNLATAGEEEEEEDDGEMEFFFTEEEEESKVYFFLAETHFGKAREGGGCL